MSHPLKALWHYSRMGERNRETLAHQACVHASTCGRGASAPGTSALACCRRPSHCWPRWHGSRATRRRQVRPTLATRRFSGTTRAAERNRFEGLNFGKGAHGAYTSVRCRGASEPAHHPGRTWGVHQGTLLLCFCGHPGAHGAYYRVRCCCAPAVSGFKSQPKRGPPKKGKLGFCLWNGKHWVFLPRGAKLSARLREAEGFGL